MPTTSTPIVAAAGKRLPKGQRGGIELLLVHAVEHLGKQGEVVTGGVAACGFKGRLLGWLEPQAPAVQEQAVGPVEPGEEGVRQPVAVHVPQRDAGSIEQDVVRQGPPIREEVGEGDASVRCGKAPQKGR